MENVFDKKKKSIATDAEKKIDEYIESEKAKIEYKRQNPLFTLPRHLKIALTGLILAYSWLLIVDPNIRMDLFTIFLALISAGTVTLGTTQVSLVDLNGVDYTGIQRTWVPQFSGWSELIVDSYGWLPIVAIFILYITIVMLVISYIGFINFYRTIKFEINKFMISCDFKKIEKIKIKGKLRDAVLEKLEQNDKYMYYSSKRPFKWLIGDGWVNNEINNYFKSNWGEIIDENYMMNSSN